MRTQFWLSLLFLILPQYSFGAVLTVEKDGSGDFQSIGEAVLSATSGDTVRVGPGRYDELTEDECFAFPGYHYRVIQTQENLTIIGAGSQIEAPGSCTIIGPEIPSESDAAQFGIASYAMCGARQLTVEDLRFENLNGAIHGGSGDYLIVERCSFGENFVSIETDFSNLIVRSSDFVAGDSSVFFLALLGRLESQKFDVYDCSFSLSGTSPLIAIAGSGNGPMKIENSVFLGSPGEVRSMGFSGSFQPVEIRNCRFRDLRYGVRFQRGEYFVNGCTFEQVNYGLFDLGFQPFTMWVENCVFEDVHKASISYHNLFGGGRVNDCTLDKGEEYVISSSYNGKRPKDSGPSVEGGLGLFFQKGMSGLTDGDVLAAPEWASREEYHLDMTNNWWGSAEPDSIHAWIEDGVDIPDYPFYVDWFPFKDEPLGVSQSTLGAFRAQFR
jgi:hypothetical protein